MGSRKLPYCLGVEASIELLELRLAVMEGEVEIVGYRFERLSWMSARASRKRASAAFSVWFDGLICSSSAFNSALPKMAHQSARILSSPGCACCQPLLSLNSVGGCSL